MPGVSEEQVRRAKEVDLLAYLQQNEPYELVQSKYTTKEYRTKTHSSLVISNGLWIHNRSGQAGKTALDFLIKMRGLGFVDAVKSIVGDGEITLGARASPSFSSLPVKSTESKSQQSKSQLQQMQSQPKKWNFYPPKPQHYSNKAVGYLQRRGISPEVINRAMREGTLYESRYYNPESKYHNIPV